MRRRDFAAAAAALIVVACGGETAASCDTLVHDSAGVQVVENPEPCGGALPTWTLAEPPILDVGRASGEHGSQLYRVTDATRTADGTYLVANDGSHEIREYDAAGTLLRSIGREGDGPGEFRALDKVAVRGDTVIALDLDLRRVTRMTWGGDVASTVTLPEEGIFPHEATRPLADGSFLLGWMVGDDALRALQRGRAHVGDVVRGEVLLARFDASGRVLDTLGVFPGFEEALGSRDGRPFSAAAPFGRAFTFAPWGDGVAVGTQERYEIRVHALDGRLVRIVRAPTPDLSITPERQAELVDRILGAEREPSLVEATTRRVYEYPRPDLAPAFGRLLADAEGNLWVSGYHYGPATPRFWEVFDPAGLRIARVGVPDRFRVFEIGADYVLGVRRDALEVEHLRAYELRKWSRP